MIDMIPQGLGSSLLHESLHMTICDLGELWPALAWPWDAHLFFADRGEDWVMVEWLVRAEFDVEELYHRVSRFGAAAGMRRGRPLPGTESSSTPRYRVSDCRPH